MSDLFTSQEELPIPGLPEAVRDLEPDDLDWPASGEGETIRVYGERDAFDATFVPENLYPQANLPERIRRFTQMQAEARDRCLSRESYVLQAPTSSGKTIAFAAPIFAAGQSAVFVYPYRALLLDQASELLDVARWFGYSEEDFGYLMGGVTGSEAIDQIHGKKFILATPDKLVSLFLAARRKQMSALVILSSANFVFDEIHAYSPMMIRSLIYFLRSVRMWNEGMTRSNARILRPTFAFVSATLPEDLWKELHEGLGLKEKNRLSGPSRTGDVDLDIFVPRRGDYRADHPVARDIVEREALGNTMVIMNDPFSAYRICRSQHLNQIALLFVGQDKQAEEDRRHHLNLFATAPDRFLLVGSNAIEAGVDLPAKNLFMETGFADSTVQRFGRTARGGIDARVALYGSLMHSMHRTGRLRRRYSREQFNRLLIALHPARPQARLLTGLAAGPYIEFWGEEARHIIEAEDLELHRSISSKGAPPMLAFRNLSPYTCYESGERIGFSPLLRKNLPMAGEKVAGKPSVERYFTAQPRRLETVDLTRVAHFETVNVEAEGRTWPMVHILAEGDFGPLGRHWSVFQVGPGGEGPPDNMILRYKGRTLNGPGTGNVARFYG